MLNTIHHIPPGGETMMPSPHQQHIYSNVPLVESSRSACPLDMLLKHVAGVQGAAKNTPLQKVSLFSE